VPGIATENYWFRRHEVAYLAARPWVRGATVIAAGAGEGFGADVLARVARRVIAVDSDAAACEHAAKAYPALTVTRADLVELPFAAGTVDAVVSLQVLAHLPDRAGFLAECARVLRPAGTLVLSTPNRLTSAPGPDATAGARPAGEELSAAELTELLEPRFRVDRLYGIHHRGRLRRLDRRYAHVVPPVPAPVGFVAAQLASPAATWHPSLRRAVASVTHRDFTFTEQNVDAALDLFVVAVRS